MDLDKIVNLTNTLLGINFGITAYLTFKSFVEYYSKRNTYRLMVALAETCMFVSSGWSIVYDLIISSTCEGTTVACIWYAFFYCFIISIGFYRLWAVSKFNNIYLGLMAAVDISILTSHIGLCKSKLSLS